MDMYPKFFMTTVGILPADSMPGAAKSRLMLITKSHGYQDSKFTYTAARIAPFNRKALTTMHN